MAEEVSTMARSSLTIVGEEYAPHRTIRSAMQLKDYMNLARRNGRPESVAYNASIGARAGGPSNRAPNAQNAGASSNPILLSNSNSKANSKRNSKGNSKGNSDGNSNRNSGSNGRSNRNNGNSNTNESEHASVGSHETEQSYRSGSSVFEDDDFLEKTSGHYQGLDALMEQVGDAPILASKYRDELKERRKEEITRLRKAFQSAASGENKFRIIRQIHPLDPDAARNLYGDLDLPAEKMAEFVPEQRRPTTLSRRPLWMERMRAEDGARGSSSGNARGNSKKNNEN